MKILRRGFTLVEIMVVVGVIAILASVAIPNFLAYRMETQKNTCIANMKSILNAEELYCMKNAKYTNNMADLCNASTGDDFLRSEPKCPCGGTYRYIEASDSAEATVTCSGGTYKEGFEHKLESTGIVVTGK